MRTLLSCLVALLLGACAHPGSDPEPEQLREAHDPSLLARCQAFFPPDRQQLVHAISFRLPHDEGGSALGVLVLNGPEIHCVLMTVEGFTLFAARSSGTDVPRVERAVPPFDRPGFAAGLMRDVRLLFRPPAGRPTTGLLPDGTPACRFHQPNRLVDLLPQPDKGWRLHEYTSQSGLKVDGCLLTTRDVEWRLTRSIHASPPRADESLGLAAILKLIATDPAGYTLNLRLLEAEPLPDTPLP